jgi:hypothetical protein
VAPIATLDATWYVGEAEQPFETGVDYEETLGDDYLDCLFSMFAMGIRLPLPLGRMDFHPDIAYGLVPTYVDSGLAYDAFNSNPRHDRIESLAWRRLLATHPVAERSRAVMAPAIPTPSLSHRTPTMLRWLFGNWGFKQGLAIRNSPARTSSGLFGLRRAFRSQLPAFNPTVRIPARSATIFSLP